MVLVRASLRLIHSEGKVGRIISSANTTCSRPATTAAEVAKTAVATTALVEKQALVVPQIIVKCKRMGHEDSIKYLLLMCSVQKYDMFTYFVTVCDHGRILVTW